MGLTNLPNGTQTFLVENNAANVKTADFTITATSDSGKTFVIQADAVTATLPAIGSGWCFTFVNDCPDGTSLFTISPNANDGIMYATSSTDDKDLVNTKATQIRGDRVTIYNIADTNYWYVGHISGIWAKGS
jgi:hypothetical protein